MAIYNHEFVFGWVCTDKQGLSMYVCMYIEKLRT